MQRSEHKTVIQKYGVWFTFALILVTGALLRLYDLEKCTFRPDSLEHAKIAQAGHSAGFIYENVDKMFGFKEILPLPYAVVNGYIQALGLPVNPFTVSLPFALMGVLCIPLAYGIGVLLFGAKRALLYAGIIACSPFLLQVSRDPYIYAFLVTGSFSICLALLLVLRYVGEGGRLGPVFHLANTFGFFLLVHTHPAGWIVAFLYASSILAMLAYDAVKRKRWVHVSLVCMCYLAVGLPVVFSSWGLRRVLQIKPMSKHPPLFPNLWEIAVRYGWGATLIRSALSVVAILLGSAHFILKSKKNRLYLGLVILAVVGSVLLNIARMKAGQNGDPRYYAVLLPIYFAFLASGFFAVEAISRRFIHSRRGRLVVQIVVYAFPFMLYALPSYTCMTLSGKPVPYRDIIRWVDTNLPKNTLVLVDRWQDPWNEMTVHNSTNVTFTFTVPDYPPDAFIRNRWRDSAKAFFKKFPDAAYLQVFKTGWNDPRIGEWSWPEEWFARRVSITNNEALVLRDLGLAFRKDYYHANTNRIVADIFYNTRDDILDRARRAGDKALVLYGPDWGYTKLWRQTGDFRDWRVLRGTAQLLAYNLTADTITVDIRMRGVSGGRQQVTVQSGAQRLSFPPARLGIAALRKVVLAPGLNRIELSALKSASVLPVILVDQLDVEVVQP